MNFSTARSERITATVSTLVAVAILAGGVTAYQSHNAPVDDVVQLESDLRFQLEVAFRHDPNERAARLDQLKEVSQAWQQSQQSSASREKLANWLLEATIRSMPGAVEALPAAPNFGAQQPQQPTDKKKPNVLVEPPAVTKNPDIVSQAPTLATPVPALASQPITFVNNTFPDPAPVETVATPLPTLTVAKATKPVRINLTELAARIAGYHNGLNEVETALRTLDANDFAALSDQVRQLDEMTRDFHFVQLYYEVLTEQERRAITAPRPMTATLVEIERRLNRNHEARSDDFLNEFDSRQQDEIAKLRRQLAEVARRVQR